MDLDLSDEQAAVRDLARRILGDRTGPERLAALEADAGGKGVLDQDLWAELGGAGLLGAGLPEEVGGGGVGFVAVHLLLEEVGATVAPVPAWESVAVGALPLLWAGAGRELLAEVLAGRAVLTAALVDAQPSDPAAPATRAVPEGDGWCLTGTETTVPFAPFARRIVVPCRADDRTVVVTLVDPAGPGVTVRPQAVLGRTPHGLVELADAHVAADDVLAADDGRFLHRLLLHARSGLASVQAGICARALRLTAEHAKRRHQFGRPIGTFQAVAHRLADAYIDAEALRLTALQAAWRLEADLPADEEVAIAAWWAAEAGHRVLHAAQHVHGGLGVDRDYPLHRYFERAKQVEAALGGPGAALRDLGAE